TIPRVSALKHPIFDLSVEKISESDLVAEFFDALDRTLSKSNRNKYLVATRLLTGVLENVKDATILPHLLTKNYVQQTINTYKTAVGKLKDKEFQQSSQKLFEALLNNLKKEGVKSKIKIKVLKKLLFYPGTFIFEKVTKSKLIQNITATLDKEGVKKLGAIYLEVVLATKDRVIDETTSERWWNMDRIYASHLLVKLLSHPSVHEESDWKIEQLTFLMRLGLLNDQSENIGHELADSLKETFYSSLDLKLTKLDDLRLILSRIVHELDEIVTEDSLETVLRHPLSRENYETWRHTVELASKIESSTKKKNVVFHVLFLHLGLQIFNNSKLASDSLKELFSCYERVKKSKKTETEVSSDDPLWIEVVVDLFLNLLSHNSHLLRSVINCVFPHLCKYMNATAIHQILSVLDPKNESNPLSKSDDEDSGEEGESANEETSDDDDDESVGSEDEENVNDKLRMALQQALGNNAESDAESVNLDNLDDEEGERLDQALGRAFKQFKPNLGRKKKQSRDEQTLTHFRIRVLDLIEIYLNSGPSMLLTLEIMLPLLQILEFSIRDDHQKPLQDRVRACLKKLSSLKKFSDCDDVSQQVLVDLLQSLLEKGTRNAIIIQDMGEKIAECCIFVLNCSQIIEQTENATPKKKKKTNSVSRVVKEGLETFFNKRDCLIPYVLFKGVLQLNWEGILELVPILTGYVFTKTVRPFRRNQAMELMKLFYNNHRFINSHQEEVKQIEESTVNFLLDCVGFFREFCGNPSGRKVREKFICNLFELLSEIKTCILGSCFKSWDAVGDAVRDCRSQMTLSKDTKAAFNKLCKNLNISSLVQMKQTIIKLNNVDETIEQETEQQEKKKKKKNLKKDKLKLKKESKELRLQSLSEGLGKRKMNWDDADEEKKLKTS
ncbi:DNA pol phi domain containing protein, partial [Asbolus verrucosus]